MGIFHLLNYYETAHLAGEKRKNPPRPTERDEAQPALVKKTELKYRILRKMGLNVISVSYDEWNSSDLFFQGANADETDVGALPTTRMGPMERRLALLRGKIEAQTGRRLEEFVVSSPGKQEKGRRKQKWGM